MAITKVIDPIPEAPQRGVDTQEQFDQKADAFLKRLETLDDDLNEWKDQCNQTQTEINNAESQAYQHKENARKWASEAEDTQVDDGEHTGYSAYHYSKKAEAEKNEAYNHKENARKWASEAEDTQVDDGEYQGYSARNWAAKAHKWANAPEDSLVDDGERTGYSAYHFYQKVLQVSANAGFKGEWDETVTYNLGESVSYNSLVYVSLQNNNTGKNPESEPDYWVLLGKDYDWDILDIQNKLAALTTTPAPFGIPYLTEDGYIDPFISSQYPINQLQNLFGVISDFSFTASTVYQANESAFIYTVVGSSDVTFYLGDTNPPDSFLILKANNTVCLFVPKGKYVEFSADTSAKIMSREGSNVFV